MGGLISPHVRKRSVMPPVLHHSLCIVAPMLRRRRSKSVANQPEMWREKPLTMRIREAKSGEFDSIWPIFEEVVSAGDTYAYPRDTSRAIQFAYRPAADEFTEFVTRQSVLVHDVKWSG